MERGKNLSRKGVDCGADKTLCNITDKQRPSLC